jgi:oxaloacetate decarboxylase alpha subunit
VREDLGFIPLVTPTSQIVGSQAVINVMNGERYKTITKETAGILKGEYGITPAPVNAELQAKVLAGAKLITCRPADLIDAEMDKLISDVQEKAKAENVTLGSNIEEDALINGLFAQVGWKFLANRNNPSAFEPKPDAAAFAAANATKKDTGVESYTVNVDGKNYNVAVAAGGAILNIEPNSAASTTAPLAAVAGSGATIESPMAGTILKVLVHAGSEVKEGDIVILMEAMKMETEIRSKFAGVVSAIHTKEGAAVTGGSVLVSL